jgi:hypothetical protein
MVGTIRRRPSGMSISIPRTLVPKRKRLNPKAMPHRTSPRSRKSKMRLLLQTPLDRNRKRRANHNRVSKASNNNSRRTRNNPPRRNKHLRRPPEKSAVRRQVLPPINRIKATTARAGPAPALPKVNSPAKGSSSPERPKDPRVPRVSKQAAPQQRPKVRMVRPPVLAANPVTLQAPEKTVDRAPALEGRGAKNPLEPVSRRMSQARPAMDPASPRISQPTSPATAADNLLLTRKK